MKKIILALLLAPIIAHAQTYPSPTFNSLTLQNPLTASNGGTGLASLGSGVATALGISADGSGAIVLPLSPNITSPTIMTSFTASGLVTTADLATQAANSVLANATGSMASPTAGAMASCSTSASALAWTSGSGFTCNGSINAASLGGATFASPGAIGGTTPAAGTFNALTFSNGLNITHATSALGIQGRFAQWVYATDFGADATGVSDSTTAIQNAINYVSGLPSGGVVYFTAGTYKISSPLSITTSGVSLIGQSAAWYNDPGVTIRTTASNTDIIDVVGASASAQLQANTISGLLLTHGINGASDDTNTSGNGILLKYTVRANVDNVTVMGMGAGIQVYSSINARITRSNIFKFFAASSVPSGSNIYGILLADDGTNMSASNTYRDIIVAFPNVSGGYAGSAYGFYYSGSMPTDQFLLNYEADEATVGIYIAASSPTLQNDIKIEKPVIDGFYKFGIQLSGFTTHGSASITGGWLASTGYSTAPLLAGIYIQNSVGSIITGNEIYGGNLISSTSQYGVLFDSSPSSDIIISNNWLRNIYTGIASTNSGVLTNSVISGNHYFATNSTNQGYGIFLGNNSANNIISSNYIDNGGNTMLSGISLNSGASNNQISGNHRNSGGTFTDGFLYDAGTGNGLFVPYPDGIIGNKTGNSVNAGSIGETIYSVVPGGSPLSLTSGTPTTLTSINLTAGDWDVWGTVGTVPAGSTVQQVLQGSISTTSATPGSSTSGAYAQQLTGSTAGTTAVTPIGMTIINLSAPETVYLVMQSNFTVSTNAGFGAIYARRRD